MDRKRWIAAVAVALLPFSTLAGTATLSWAPVTERTDGTPVTITEYRIYYGTGPETLTAVQPVQGTSYTLEGLSEATWYFAATAVDDAGLESAKSTVVSKKIVGTVVPPPGTPGGLTVQEDARTAYTLVQSADRLVLVPVGTVPAGTPCEDTVVRDANGVVGYLVPRASVEWSGSVRPQVVVAPCSN